MTTSQDSEALAALDQTPTHWSVGVIETFHVAAAEQRAADIASYNHTAKELRYALAQVIELDRNAIVSRVTDAALKGRLNNVFVNNGRTEEMVGLVASVLNSPGLEVDHKPRKEFIARAYLELGAAARTAFDAHLLAPEKTIDQVRVELNELLKGSVPGEANALKAELSKKIQHPIIAGQSAGQTVSSLLETFKLLSAFAQLKPVRFHPLIPTDLSVMGSSTLIQPYCETFTRAAAAFADLRADAWEQRLAAARMGMAVESITGGGYDAAMSSLLPHQALDVVANVAWELEFAMTETFDRCDAVMVTRGVFDDLVSAAKTLPMPELGGGLQLPAL